MRGIITKGIGGLYTVESEGGIYECSVRGKFRQKKFLSPLVGDYVDIEPVDEELSAINEILPRKNMLIRPNVANIDNLIITFAVQSPKPDLLLVDKLSAVAISKNIGVIISITKSDLQDAGTYAEIYKKSGFPVTITGKGNKEDIGLLKELTKDKVTAFAGASGVGKSTLLNSFGEEFLLKTGSVSEKIERGKHTTRHAELLPLSYGGYVLDTPGFSSFEVTDIEIANCFPEFRAHADLCRFNDCTHRNEPDCGVKNAVDSGEIPTSRYENYLKMFEEQKEYEKYNPKG
ncbi:MAG: ribosome small subunit-dependent GTPase A [Clostridia bacterium]|nr:ribosome small subunit-dependent GTPase A [Clostridia bacterium]